MILFNLRGHNFIPDGNFNHIENYIKEYRCTKCKSIILFNVLSDTEIVFKHFENIMINQQEIMGNNLEHYLQNEILTCDELIIKNIIA